MIFRVLPFQSLSRFGRSLFTHTYSVSVLAGNLGRASMSKQEMVRLLHSEHSQTAGQASAPEAALQAGSVRSASSAITCMPAQLADTAGCTDDHNNTQKPSVWEELRGSPLPAWSESSGEICGEQICAPWGWRWRCSTVGLDVVSNLRGGWKFGGSHLLLPAAGYPNVPFGQISADFNNKSSNILTLVVVIWTESDYKCVSFVRKSKFRPSASPAALMKHYRHFVAIILIDPV